MGTAEDYGLDSFCRKWLLVLLDIPDEKNHKPVDILRINKIFRYFDYLLRQKNLDFSNYNLGAVSDEIRDTVDEFEDWDLIAKDPTGKYKLTELGEDAKQEVESGLESREVKMLKFAKTQLNNLNDDELLYFMYRTFPETKEHSTEIDRLEKKKETLVSSLYEKGKISSATASKWLNVSEETFLRNRKIPINA